MSFFPCSCCQWYLSLGKSILHLVVNCQISSYVWRTLEQALASTSNSRIMQLYGSLQDLRQGDESVTQFMQKAKASFDELVVAGRPVLLKDFNLYVFHGLQREFKNLVTSLETKAEPLSYTDLYRHLLMHEFLHKTSPPSMGYAAINAPLLPTPNILLCHFVHGCEDKSDDDEYQWSERKWIIFGIHRPHQFE